MFNLQSEACNLRGLRDRYGRSIAFVGGVASGLMLAGGRRTFGKPRGGHRAPGPRGGLILAPDQPLAFPPENEAALAAAAREYGRYPPRLT